MIRLSLFKKKRKIKCPTTVSSPSYRQPYRNQLLRLSQCLLRFRVEAAAVEVTSTPSGA